MLLYTGIVLLVMGLCVFIYFKNNKQLIQLKNTIASKNAELNQLQKKEEKLLEEHNALQSKLRHSIEDPVTHLQGWGLFTDRVMYSIHESSRYQFTLAVLYVDINDFKVINEALGYEVGDAVLNVVSQRIEAAIRRVDSMSRFSKDTFVVLLNQLGKPETAAIVAQRILESIAEPVLVNEHEFYITASIGISIYPVDGADASTLFRNADQALVLAKGKDRQNYQFYQETIHTNSLRELALSTGLKRDTFIKELEISYQPIMRAKTKTVFCMQALLHWRHPELGLIEPEELLNFAEKHGKSNTLFEWLLKQTCEQFVKWRSIGFKPELLGLSLSIKQLKNSQFIYQISQILQGCDFKPEWLLLEIKENITDSFENVEKAFNMLKYLNIKLAIDHFGVGQCSIRDLQNVAVHYLKLDQSLTSDIEHNEQTRALLHAILVLAKSLAMQLIVQGVDSEAQMRVLRDNGCELLQGRFMKVVAEDEKYLSV